MTRGDRVIAFITRYIRVPEGKDVGKPLVLLPFQTQFIRAVYDNPAGTAEAYLSIARKNGKTGLIAALCLAHIVGPEARQNSQIVSGAMSRDQAALVFRMMQKMIGLSPELRHPSVTRITPSQKAILGVQMGVEYRALSAEAGTAHGLSPVLAILDEVGQVKGPTSDFIDAITTSQGAYDDALLIAISTQAATDNDLLSRWLDDAATSKDRRIVSHVYSAPAECDVLDKKAWRAANPALGKFRSEKDLADRARRAERLPAEENSFRWLFLNQRIEATAPFISRSVWEGCAAKPVPLQPGDPVWAGLDLSEVADLTALVLVGEARPVRGVYPTFWLPGDGLGEKAKADRVPYDVWERQGYLQAPSGPVVDYEFVAHHLAEVAEMYDLRKIGFDRWNFRHLQPWLLKAGFTEDQVEGDDAIFVPMGQGFQTMSPALRDLESAVLKQELAHGNHPVLSMCAANAVVDTDPAGNRKLTKRKSRGRIDGMVALAMALSVAGTDAEGEGDMDDYFAALAAG